MPKNLVLLVDDEDIIRLILKSTLRKLPSVTGFLEAESVDSAIAIYEAHKEEIALTITDNNMRKRNGIELVRYIGDRTPIIMLSGLANFELNKDVLNYGGLGLMYKPFDGPLLTSICNEIIQTGKSPTLDNYLVDQKFV